MKKPWDAAFKGSTCIFARSLLPSITPASQSIIASRVPFPSRHLTMANSSLWICLLASCSVRMDCCMSPGRRLSGSEKHCSPTLGWLFTSWSSTGLGQKQGPSQLLPGASMPRPVMSCRLGSHSRKPTSALATCSMPTKKCTLARGGAKSPMADVDFARRASSLTMGRMSSFRPSSFSSATSFADRSSRKPTGKATMRCALMPRAPGLKRASRLSSSCNGPLRSAASASAPMWGTMPPGMVRPA
mmetsp:Transcript_4504/g.12295  ORF Transcript_4504/g.12295 Transcript_4504/m.12295 type:complete len:244 (-) Transcript_4504:562-1293(-)